MTPAASIPSVSVRQHSDPLAASLPPLVVDRLRIVRCAAFRRLQQKTQVFVAPESDHFRTRLTHTLEVAHLARTLAERTAAFRPRGVNAAAPNADLAEVVALAHDLGHPPFGHAGETALNECMKEHGGFEHNRHTLRIVEELEHPYPEFRGLNLTRVVRECLAKHQTQYDQPGNHPLQDGRPPPAEGLLVDLADRLAYALHDLLDGLYAGLLDPAALRDLRIWQHACGDSLANRPPSQGGLQGGAAGDLTDPDAWRGHLRPTVDRIELRVLEDVVHNFRADIAGAASLITVRLSPELEAELRELDEFLFRHLYRSLPLVAADEQARHVVTSVFGALIAAPDRLPTRFGKRIGEAGVYRVVADYVAGMTDRYCAAEHTRLCG